MWSDLLKDTADQEQSREWKSQPGFWRFPLWSEWLQLEWREAGRAWAQRHQILQGQKLHYVLKSLISCSGGKLWRKRPFSEAWKSFELLHWWQIHLILKAGEPTSANTWPPPPILPPSHRLRPLAPCPGKRQWPWADSGTELNTVTAFLIKHQRVHSKVGEHSGAEMVLKT